MGFIGRRNRQTDGRTHRAIEESLRRHRRVGARSTDLRKLLEGTVNVLVFCQSDHVSRALHVPASCFSVVLLANRLDVLSDRTWTSANSPIPNGGFVRIAQSFGGKLCSCQWKSSKFVSCCHCVVVAVSLGKKHEYVVLVAKSHWNWST